MRSGPGAAALAAVTLAWAACASPGVFERLVDTGRYEEAARTFESDSTLWSKPDALARAARVYSDPTLPSYDMAKARQALERLTTGFPASPEAKQAAPILPLLAAVAQLRGELAQQTAELERRAAAADTMATTNEAAERDLQALRRRVQRLEADLEQARQELERLKAIDLRRRPDVRR